MGQRYASEPTATCTDPSHLPDPTDIRHHEQTASQKSNFYQKQMESESCVDDIVPLARRCVDWRSMKECKKKKKGPELQITLQSNKGGVTSRNT